MSKDDPFTGLWKCNISQSKFSTPPPSSWTQRITASSTNLSVREEISRSGALPAVVSVDARFDGKDYRVEGSPVAQTIAYTRNGSHIDGTARKNGAVCLREAIEVSTDGMRMTMKYFILAGEQEVASGVAVFERASD